MSINKEKLIEMYVDRVVDNMDVGDLMNFVMETLTNTYSEYSLDEMVTEIEDSYPDILEDLSDADEEELIAELNDNWLSRSIRYHMTVG